jgi:hypothetical protein
VDVAARDDVVTEQRTRQVREAVDTWTGQLINLDGRNQLLYYRDLKVGTLDLADAERAAVDGLVSGRTIRLSQLFRADLLADRLKRARTIRNKSRELLEERGVATCYLAMGMATWSQVPGRATPAAPVLLQQVTLAARGVAEDDFELALTGEVDVNPTLLHLLEEQFGVSVAEEDLLGLLPGPLDTSRLFERLVKEAADVSGFAIAPRYVIGTFSYAKLPMVIDLVGNTEALIVHDVVAAIAGDHAAQRAVAGAGVEVGAADVDRESPADEFVVLDADSSQSLAINAAVAGQSMVVSGPPGTGKSQTIANLIATLIARGQSVLFVAEKRAAIAAVLDRLARVGLADLVLDLHDGAGSRRKVAESLGAALRAAGTVARPDQAELHERLVDSRQRLDAHDAAMHQARQPWGLSVFEARCALAELAGRHGEAASTQIRFRGDVLTALDAATFRRITEVVREFAGLSPQETPWAGAVVVSAEQAEAARGTVERLRIRTLGESRGLLKKVLAGAGLAHPRTVAQWRPVFELLDGVAATLAVFDPAVYSGPLPEMLAAARSRAWRRANPAAPGAKAGWGERRRLRKAARALWRGAGQPDRGRSGWGGGVMSGLSEALDAALRQRTWWAQVRVDSGPPRVPAQFAEAKGRYEQLVRELAALGNHFPDVDFTSLEPDALQSTLDNLARDERTLRKLPRLHELGTAIHGAGLDDLLDELRSRRAEPELAVAVLRYSWNMSILDRVGFSDRAVASFDGALLGDAVQTFRAADTDHIRQTATRVRRAAAERLTAVRDDYPTEGRLVEAQAARKTRHLPLRQLFAAAPHVMTALKPCWAMSPLVVSQLLPGDRPYFDVVVFDEASQIVPADAVPAILRARRIIVAGDQHQLPPTSFFASVSADDTDQPAVVADDGTINLALTSGFESILDVATATLGGARVRSLTWHYRSHDERLVAFSNAWVYDRSLRTFPGVAGGDCLCHVLVDQHGAAAGPEDSATAEVNRVVELVIAHATARPDESLGVITMGIKHAERIDAALRRALAERPALHAFFDEDQPEKFFVKNLERVQGDERDAIVLSIGYGKSADGKLPYRFGPLLQEGGQRRLNVAITRARGRMTVVSCFGYHDMDPARSTSDGVRMLRAYLRYAASGGTHLGDAAVSKPELNPFEISVRDGLLAAGIPVTPHYGVAGHWIDFAAAHPTQPGRMVLAIEADGPSYHASPSVRDRDRLRQEQLERLGWRFHRIWSTDWFTDPEICVARARLAYEQAVATVATAIQPATVATAIQPATVATAIQPAIEVDETMEPSGDGDGDGDGDGRGPRPSLQPGQPITEYSDRQLASLIRWIESDTLLRTEDELLAAFVSELGYRRRGTRIVDAFQRALTIARADREAP